MKFSISIKLVFLILLSFGLFSQQLTAQTTINLASQCNCEVLAGSVIPTAGAPVANPGNLYIHDATGDIYSFDGTVWTLAGDDKDYDWYKVGTTEPPSAITDNKTTQGFLGVGVATPAQQLHIGGNVRADGRNFYFGANQRLFGDNNTALYFNSGNATTSQLIMRDSDNEVYGRLNGSGDGQNFGLMDKNAEWVFLSREALDLSFRISNSEKFRVNAAGNFGIGVTSPSARLDVNGDARIRTLAAGAAADDLVVANASGVLRKIPRSSLGLSPTAGNDIDVMGSQINVEPVLDFVHTLNSPAQNMEFSAGGNIFMKAWFDGHVGIGELSPAAGLHVNHDDGVIAEGTFGSGQSLSAGGGTRLVWSSKHAALRAGQVSGTQWDDANIGNYSLGFGSNTIASGGFSFAGGATSTASGDHSFAYGVNAVASGARSLSIGNASDASNTNAIAIGPGALASGNTSIALGSAAAASNNNTLAIGFQTVASGNGSMALGFQSEAIGTGSKSFGGQTIASGFNSMSFGEATYSRSRGEIAVGMFNTDYTPAAVNTWNANDRIFVVGNGQDDTNRSDAVTVYKDGTTRLHGKLDMGGYTIPNTGALSNSILVLNPLNEMEWQPKPNSFGGAGNDIDIINSPTNLISIEPKLDFVHTINTPTTELTGQVMGVTSLHVGNNDSNTGFGYDAGTTAANGANTSIGYKAGKSLLSGRNNNTFVGYLAGELLGAAQSNTLIGSKAGGKMTTGTSNLMVGNDAGRDATSGSFNTIVGGSAGAVVNGSSNILIGNNAGNNVSGNYSNKLHIDNATFATSLIYGDFSTQEVGINWNVGTSGVLPNTLSVNGNASKSSAGSWLGNSDQRLKKNIQYMDSKHILEKVLEMKGVTYEWNDNETGLTRPEGTMYGFIAQDLQQVWPKNVKEDKLGFLETAYGSYDAMFVEAFKELDKRIKELETENATLKSSGTNTTANARIHQLETENEELKARLDRIEKLLMEK